MPAFFEQQFNLPEDCQFTKIVTFHFTIQLKKGENLMLFICPLFAFNLYNVLLPERLKL